MISVMRSGPGSPGTIGGPALIVRRTSDSSAKQNNTPADDDTLLWTTPANAVWRFHAYLLISAASATMDFKLGLTVPSGTSASFGVVGTSGTTTTGWWAPGTAGTPGTLAAESGTVTTGTLNGTIGVIFAGIVVASSTAGIVNLKWSQNSTEAADLKLLTQSFLEVVRLA